MTFTTGHLAEQPLPPGIAGALSLAGYQLLVDVAGVGAGRLGQQAFLLVAADPDPAVPDPGTQISLHQAKLRDERDMTAYTQLAAQLGFLRLAGYRLTLERAGLRSKISMVDPATGGMAITIPEKHPGKLLGGGLTVSTLLAKVRGLGPAGPPPDLSSPDALRQVLLELALRDDSIGGADAVEMADRALAQITQNPTLDPAAAIEAAKSSA